MKRIRLLLIFLFSSSLNIVLANHSYPEGFEEFIQFTTQQVVFIGANGGHYNISISANHNTIKLTNENKDTEQIYQALFDDNIKAEHIERIIADLKKGIKTDFSECNKINITDCAITPEHHQFLFDFDRKLLLLFVNPSLLLEGKGEVTLSYQKAINPMPAFINHAALNVDKYTSQDTQFRWDDELYLGLNYGYIHSDMQYRSQDSDFELYKLAYHLDYENYHLRLGQFRGYQALNSTDFLRQGSTLNSTLERVVELGSSRNLLKGKHNQSKLLYYYAPVPGRLLITDISNDRIIVNKNTEQGQQSLSYAELPYGLYEVTVEVKNGDDVVSSENYFIYNKLNDDLALNEFDFVIGLGSIDGTSMIAKDFDGQDEILFARGLFSSKITESMLFGVGVLGSEEGEIVSSGFSFYLPNNININAAYNYAFSGEQFLNTTFNIDRFSLSYLRLKGGDEFNIASTLYGYGDFERLYAGYSFSLGDLGYVRLNSSYNFNQNEETNYENFTSNFGLSSQLNSNIRVDMDLGYSSDTWEDAFDEDNLSVSLSLSINLEPNWGLSYTGLTFGDRNGLSSYRNSLSASRLWKTDNSYGSGYASHSFTPSTNEQYSDGSLSAQYAHDMFSGDGYLSYDSNQRYGASFGLKNSLIVADSELYSTVERGRSYALVNLESDASKLQETESLKGLLTIQSAKERIRQASLYNKKTVIKLEDYQQYQLELDTQVADLYNVGDRYTTGYSYPSGVIKLDTKVGLTNRLVAGFKDIFDNPITGLQCEGVGCIDISNIVDGVFNITVVNKMPYTLKAGKQICSLNITDNNKVNYGNNYCLPKLALGQERALSNDDGETKIVRYLGEFYKDSDVFDVIDVFDGDDVELYLQESPFSLSVYISYADESLISMEQIETIESLIRFASVYKPVEIGENK